MKLALFLAWPAKGYRSVHKLYTIINGAGLVLLLWCSACTVSLSQPLNLDSLWNSWHNKSLPDTTRLNALLAISTNAQNLHADTTFVYAQTGYQFAESQNLAAYKMKFLNFMGAARFHAGEFEAAETLTRRSMALADSLHDDEQYAKSLQIIGNIYNTRSDYATSIDYYLRVSKLAEKLNNQKLLLTSTLSIGNAYLGHKEFDKALYHYQKHLDIADVARDTPAISVGLSSIGIAHQATNNLTEALKFYTQGLQMAKKVHLAGTYGISYMNIGDVYALMNEPTLAIGNYRSAMNEYTNKGNKIGQAQTLYRIANVYKTQFPDSTIILARQALEMAQAADKKNLMANIALLLYETYEAQGRYQPALDMYKLYSQTQDSIYNQKQLQSIARSEAKYEYEKQELEDRMAFDQELARNRLAVQRKYFLLIGVIVLVFMSGYVYLITRNVKHRSQRTEALLKISQLRETIAKQTLSASGVGGGPILNKKKIEAAVQSKLGDTAWHLLQLLADTPTISNREIAESLFLSEEGISSSLRRMYAIFDIQSGNSKNHKIALLTKAIELSMGD